MCSYVLPAFLLASAAAGQAPPGYGHDFLTVGAPGNRPANQQEAPLMYLLYNPPRLVGAVGYEYRITRTEVTNAQWLEFVRAYAPYYTGSPHASAFTGSWISWNGSQYVIPSGADGFAADPSWRMAARYVNWLHNGKASGQWAFENGAYDTATFTQNPNGTYNDQARHWPDAKYWIATEDEWVKAMYYDPHRYGPGQEGYWRMPDGGNDPLAPGLPGQGGETNAGMNINTYGIGPYLNADAYAHVQSPWGLLGGSGGAFEFTEDWEGAGPNHFSRLRRGSKAWLFPHWSDDSLDVFSGVSPIDAWAGFRVVSVVPAPGVPAAVLVVLAITPPWSRTRRNRRPN